MIPAWARIDRSKPGPMVSPACKGTVIRPPRAGCLSWACDPFWVTATQPNLPSAATTSRLVTRGSGGIKTNGTRLLRHRRTAGEQCREPFVDLRPSSPAYIHCRRTGDDRPSIAIHVHRVTKCRRMTRKGSQVKVLYGPPTVRPTEAQFGVLGPVSYTHLSPGGFRVCAQQLLQHLGRAGEGPEFRLSSQRLSLIHI